jgi:hypothetical protein
MGKLAASVDWSEIAAAIQANAQRDARLQGGAASSSITMLPPDVSLTWLPGWTEDTTFMVTDAVSLALWVRDPLYRVASSVIRRSMEMEEAASLLHASEIAWKQYNGRARGWVRKHLEEDLRLRAGGGDPLPDAWEAIRTTKRPALLMDYVCIMRGLRAALWWPEHKAVTVAPLTLSTSDNGGVQISCQVSQVVQLNCQSGHMLLGPSAEFSTPGPTWNTLLVTSEFTWAPPLSSPSIGSHTVAQIQERIQTMNSSSSSVQSTGGRTALWNRLMWLTLEESLNHVPVKGEGQITALSKEYDGPTTQ